VTGILYGKQFIREMPMKRRSRLKNFLTRAGYEHRRLGKYLSRTRQSAVELNQILEKMGQKESDAEKK
jgi:hypothetical protein